MLSTLNIAIKMPKVPLQQMLVTLHTKTPFHQLFLPYSNGILTKKKKKITLKTLKQLTNSIICTTFPFFVHRIRYN